MVKDIKGRPYALVSEVKAGTTIEVDGGFTCINAGELREVEEDERGLCFKCELGNHYLDGQISVDLESDQHFYIGVYLVSDVGS